MSTGYGWEGLRQVCATLLSARHVPERLSGGNVYLGRLQVFGLYLFIPHHQYTAATTRGIARARSKIRQLGLYRISAPPANPASGHFSLLSIFV